MPRISRDQMFMDIAHVVSKRSTCCRLNVGAVLVTEHHRIVSIGYNGAPSSEPHCTGNDCPGATPGGCPTIHAEVNAFAYLPPYTYEDLTLYTTDAPCLACSRWIREHGGVKRVVFCRNYRDVAGISLLMGAGIIVQQITPAGYVIDAGTGRVYDV